jgi:prephenate dehydrogenase
VSFDSASIIGLGLIGGSLARDLAALGINVSGYDADHNTLSAALDSGALNAALPATLDQAAAQDLVIVATPVREVPAILERLAKQQPQARLITDVGSTKQAIVAAAHALGLGKQFVGSHPLAGLERSGWSASRTGLFRDAPAFLCPTTRSDPAALEHAQELWRLVGACPQLIDPAEHDARMAWISHLPQAVASALARALHERGFTRKDLGPGGRDMTRLAASDARIWTDILLTNRIDLARALAEAASQLTELRSVLLQGDEQAVQRILLDGNSLDSTPG